MMNSPVDYQQDGVIVTISLNNPDKRNGLTPSLIDGMVAALKRANDDAGVRCVILTGIGKTFSAGGDPKKMLTPGLYPDMSDDQIREHYRNGIQRIPMTFHALEVPVIAAINGPAIGAGCDLACLCDMRIASDNATFATSFVKLGLVPGDGGAWLLPRIVGQANAAQMLLTGDAIDAVAALRIGLVSTIASADELMNEARRLALRVAANAPHAIRLTKQLIADCKDQTLPGALALSAAAQAKCHKTEDHREAVMAFLQKRSPHYKGK